MSNPHAVTKQFEAELCAYTGAPYAVTTNSCTAALLLAVAWHFAEMQRKVDEKARAAGHVLRMQALYPPIEIPKRTYVSVPQSIIHAGGRPTFRDEDWRGGYELKPLDVWDCARLFTSGMYLGTPGPYWCTGGFGGRKGHMLCVSFHASKTLGLEQGGAILHGNPEADAWLRRARFDGRTEGVAPKDDTFTQVGWHAYLNPSTAAQGILRLHSLPRHNEPLQNDPYPDLSTMECFK
jgi:dTDP-4-amino-4,6-dideoxygalactose transaminase